MVRNRLALVFSFRDKAHIVIGLVLGVLAWWGELLPWWAAGFATFLIAVDVRLTNDPGQ